MLAALTLSVDLVRLETELSLCLEVSTGSRTEQEIMRAIRARLGAAASKARVYEQLLADSPPTTSEIDQVVMPVMTATPSPERGLP